MPDRFRTCRRSFCSTKTVSVGLFDDDAVCAEEDEAVLGLSVVVVVLAVVGVAVLSSILRVLLVFGELCVDPILIL